MVGNWQTAATVTSIFATVSRPNTCQLGGEEFETPPPSPSYSPHPSDDEEDNDSGGPGLWTEEELLQREEERQGRVVYLANKAHIDLIHALPEDNCPTLDSVLEFTEWISLSNWHLFGSDVDALTRIMVRFMPGGIN